MTNKTFKVQATAECRGAIVLVQLSIDKRLLTVSKLIFKYEAIVSIRPQKTINLKWMFFYNVPVLKFLPAGSFFWGACLKSPSLLFKMIWKWLFQTGFQNLIEKKN